MTRYWFGDGANDFVYVPRMVAGINLPELRERPVTMWDAKTGGTPYDDLLVSGSPATSVTGTADGHLPAFQGPEGVPQMWADAGATRFLITSTGDLADAIDARAIRKDSQVFNVLDHGLVADTIDLADCSVALGTNQVTSPSANFTNADVGKVITIGGAGAAGAALASAPSGALRTIATVLDSHNITFDDPLHGLALTAVLAARSVTATTTIGSNVVNAPDGAFTTSDVFKTITIPGAYGDPIPTVRTEHGAMSSGSTTLTSAWAAFTTADVGKYVRVVGAGGTGHFLTAKITARASATSVTLDTAASATVAGVDVFDMGAPRNVPVVIVSVVSATQVKVRKMADFPVTSAASAVSGGAAAYGTNNQAGLAALVAAVPDNSTLYFPNGRYMLPIASVTLSKPIIFEGQSRNGSCIHYGASGGRIIAGSSNVTIRRLGFRSINGSNLFGNAAAASAFTDWLLQEVLLTGCGLNMERQGRVGNTGIVTTTGSGHTARVTLDRVEVDQAHGTIITIQGVDLVTVIEPYLHDSGSDTDVTVGLKISGGAKYPRLLGGIFSGLIGDGIDVFDCYAPHVDGPRGWLLGQKLLDYKWTEVSNYNAPERALLTNMEAWFCWAGGFNFSAPRLAVSNIKAIGIRGYGVSRNKGSTSATVSAHTSIFSNIEAASCEGDGITGNGGDRDRWNGVLTPKNGGNGCSVGGVDINLTDVISQGNFGPTYAPGTTGHIYFPSTAQRPRLTRCLSDDTGVGAGQFTAHATALASGICCDGYGEEAGLAAGAQPTFSKWPLGATVKNTTAPATYWHRDFTGFVAGTVA